MNRKIIPFLYCILYSTFLCGQISPPGLGESRSAGWFAFGLRQNFDTLGRKQSITYIGLGRTSGPVSDNPYKRQAILVLNQEFYNQFRKHWQYSVAVSYRTQNEYEDLDPYKSADPNAKQEFRLYGRYSYIWSKSRWRIMPTFRQELRKFFTPDFKNWEETLQLRSRARIQMVYMLNKHKTQRLILTAEALFSTSQENSPPKNWSRFGYHESRFCLYYSLSPKNSAFIYNVGYMNNLLGQRDLMSVHYLAVDVIWKDPFFNSKNKK